MSKASIIETLKIKLRTLPECCFKAEELDVISSLLPKQEYDIVRPALLISCTLPIPLLEKVKFLVNLETIPSASSFFRRALVSFQQNKYLPPLPVLLENTQRANYSFRPDKELAEFWKTIPFKQRVSALESWAWENLKKYEDDLN